MKHAKRIIALLLSLAILTVCALSTLASAASVEEKVVSTDTVYPDVTTDREATVEDNPIDYAASEDSHIGNTELLYYNTTPWYYIPAIIEYATSKEAQSSDTYVEGLTDVAVVVPASMGAAFAKSFYRNITKTLSGMIQDQAEMADYWGEEAYKYAGDAGTVAAYTTSYAVGATTNTALLLLVQGVVNVAIVVLVPITWIALPLLGVQDGSVEIPRIIGQLKDLKDVMD